MTSCLIEIKMPEYAPFFHKSCRSELEYVCSG